MRRSHGRMLRAVDRSPTAVTSMLMRGTDDIESALSPDKHLIPLLQSLKLISFLQSFKLSSLLLSLQLISSLLSLLSKLMRMRIAYCNK